MVWETKLSSIMLILQWQTKLSSTNHYGDTAETQLPGLAEIQAPTVHLVEQASLSDGANEKERHDDNCQDQQPATTPSWVVLVVNPSSGQWNLIGEQVVESRIDEIWNNVFDVM